MTQAERELLIERFARFRVLAEREDPGRSADEEALWAISYDALVRFVRRGELDEWVEEYGEGLVGSFGAPLFMLGYARGIADGANSLKEA